MKRTIKIIFTIGISASGKSTWANEKSKKSTNCRVIERDQIRRSIVWDKKISERNFQVPFQWNDWNWKWENQVTEIWNSMIDNCLSIKEIDTIICSDTNLNEKRLENTINEIKKRNNKVIIDVEFKHFPISYEEAVIRDTYRKNSVGAFVIAQQYSRYCRLTKPQANKNPNCPKAIIVDLDGTLSHNNSGRGHYDDYRYDEDTPNIFLKNVVRMMSQIGYTPIFLSGREATPVGEEKTKNWIRDQFSKDLVSYHLFLRDYKDLRSDEIVKEEIYWKKVDNNYNVEAVFDDRPKVCRMWRSIGLDVYQCGDPHKEF